MMMLLLAGVAACAGLFLGVVGGFAVRERARRWCPGCGVTLTAEHCPHPIAARKNGAAQVSTGPTR